MAAMVDIEFFSTAVCPYCNAAKQLLARRGLAWRERRIDTDADALRVMLERTGGARTVPQIFVNGTLVGGFDALASADRSGVLRQLVGEDP